MERWIGRLLIVVCAGAVLAGTWREANAVTVRLDARALVTESFQVRGVQFTLRTSEANHISVTAAVRRLKMNDRWTVNRLRAHCSVGEWAQTRLGCGPMLLTGEHAATGPVHAQIGRLEVDGLQGAEAVVRIKNLQVTDAGTQFRRVLGVASFDVGLQTDALNLVYQSQTWQLQEPLAISAWGGTIEVSNLRATWPPSGGSRVGADIVIKSIDLERLTSAYAFGKIQGRLNGTVRDLYFVNGEPERFAAAFATAVSDGIPQTISQRALDNLTQLSGGGPTHALSRGLAEIFSEFSYSQLGWQCTLRSGICTMDGIAAAASGYVIVQRGLLPPWIDVIGYNRRVDWRELVQRLQGIATNPAPVVK